MTASPRSMSLTATPLTLSAAHSASATLRSALRISGESLTVPLQVSSGRVSRTVGSVPVRIESSTATTRPGHSA